VLDDDLFAGEEIDDVVSVALAISARSPFSLLLRGA
jgi:hypothetical protein